MASVTVKIPNWAVVLTCTLVLSSFVGAEAAEPVTVPYDAATGISQPVSCTAASIAEMGGLLPLQLSEPIGMPSYETNRIAVVRVTGGPVTAANFRDVTGKPYGLPMTFFEVVAEGSGEWMVYLLARPTINYVATKDSKNRSIGEAANWGDGRKPFAGADYYVKGVSDNYTRTGGGDNIASFRFGGGSLSILEAWDAVRDYAENCTLGNLRLFSNTGINNFSANETDFPPRVICGNIFVDASASDVDHPAIIEFDDLIGRREIQSAFTGSGTVRIRVHTSAESLYMTGASPDFAGKMIFMPDKTGRCSVCATNGLAFGGPLPANDDYAVQFKLPSGSASQEKAFSLLAQDDMTIDAANRGWYMYDNAALGAVAGKTLTFCPPKLGVKTKLYKIGAGTLALGCKMGGSGMLNFFVEEGFVMPLNDQTTFRWVEPTFFEGAGIRVKAGSVETPNGLFVNTLKLADGAQSIRVAIDVPEDQRMAKTRLTVPFCKLPTKDNPDFSVNFKVEVRGYSAQVKSSEVTDGGVRYTVYSAELEPLGMVLFIR